MIVRTEVDVTEIIRNATLDELDELIRLATTKRDYINECFEKGLIQSEKNAISWFGRVVTTDWVMKRTGLSLQQAREMVDNYADNEDIDEEGKDV